MWKDTVTLIAALIAAIASTGNAYYGSASANALERQKWEQTRLDQADTALRLAVADFAKELSTGTQRAVWLIWMADQGPNAVSETELRSYETDIRAILPRLFSAQILVAAHDQSTYRKLAVLSDRLYSLDADIGRATIAFRKSRPSGLIALRALRQASLDFANRLPTEMAGAMSAASAGNAR